jgi:hypothetical protein
MTPSEVARAFGVRHIGSRKWWSAKCPAHKDRMASLSITDMGQGRTRLVCFAGCKQADILSVKKMTWRDLRLGPVTPEVRQMMTLEKRYEALERQVGLAAILQAIDKGKRAYWSAAERRIEAEIQELRPLLEPEKVFQEWRERMFKKRINKYGWDEMWSEWEARHVSDDGLHTMGS